MYRVVSNTETKSTWSSVIVKTNDKYGKFYWKELDNELSIFVDNGCIGGAHVIKVRQFIKEVVKHVQTLGSGV